MSEYLHSEFWAKNWLLNRCRFTHMNLVNSIRSNTHQMQTTKTTQGKKSGLMKVLDSDIVYCSVSKLTLTALRTWVDQQARLGGAHALSSREPSQSSSKARQKTLARGGLLTCEFGSYRRKPSQALGVYGPFSCCFCVLFYCFSCFITVFVMISLVLRLTYLIIYCYILP